MGRHEARRATRADGARVAGDGVREGGRMERWNDIRCRSSQGVRWLVAALLSVVPSFHLSVHLSAQRWRPEDRALISDFSYVEAGAVSPFTLFPATTHGLTIYDRPARTWRLPVTAPPGDPAAPVPLAPRAGVDNAAWLRPAGRGG